MQTEKSVKGQENYLDFLIHTSLNWHYRLIPIIFVRKICSRKFKQFELQNEK